MSAFTQEFDYDANQLQFNLDVPARARNLAFQSRRPEALVIERFGPHTVPAPTSPARPGNKSLQFSAVSEDSLNVAVQLAKRDLKKQKEENSRKQAAKKKSKTTLYGRSRSPASPSRSHTKITHSKQYKEKLKKRAQRDKGKPLSLLERERGWNSQTVASQTRARDRTPPARTMPASSNSPPTRDPSCQRALTGDEKIMHEIKRLRDEMDKCMRQIKEIEEISKKAPAHTPRYHEDVEDIRRRRIRAEEQTARSSRMIYMLNQQVKAIQGDIDRMQVTGGKLPAKSPLLARLAAAHRGAVRVLQNFVSHLPDYDLREGVPRSYQELGLLLRQLSLCCAQLEVSGQNVSTDNILLMLKDMADLNQAIDQSITKPASPPRPCQVTEVMAQGRKSRSPTRREPVSSRSDTHRKEVGFVEENENLETNSMSNSAFMVEKLEGQEGHLTDRDRAIKAGIQALVQAADSAPPSARIPRPCNQGKPRKTSPVPPLNLPQTPRTPASPRRGMASSPSRASGRSQHLIDRRARSPADILRARNNKIKKGLLLPAELQSHRGDTDRLLLDHGEAHYAEPTYSSRVKEVKLNEFNRPGSPLSTKRSGSVSPSRSHHKAAAARQVWLDRQDSKREIYDLDKERQERQRIEDVSLRLGRSPEWVSRAEKKIKAKMEPLLSQAEVEINADLLAEMMMKDLVSEAALEIQGLHDDRQYTNDAMAIQDGPSLETMLQKLQLMEDESDAIRRRWATIVYEDEFTHNKPASERPRSPSPIQLTRSGGGKKPDPVTDIVNRNFNTDVSADGVIMFTKSRPGRVESEHLSLTQDREGGAYSQILSDIREGEGRTKPVRVSLSEEVLSSIGDYRDRYSAFLKRMNYQAVGRFNPWQIVDQLADEIMADCLDSVAKELWEINNEIVEHTYKTEFKNGGCSVPTGNESFS